MVPSSGPRVLRFARQARRKGAWNARCRAAVVTAALTAAACAPTVPPTAEAPPVPEVVRALTLEAAALAEPGPLPVDVTVGQLRSASGCVVRYEVVTPVRTDDGDDGTEYEHGSARPSELSVVWAHGFLRDLGSMRGWARHAAGHGVRSVVVSFCNSSAFAGRHDRNAADLRLVADAVRTRPDDPVVYAGFSAGGLSALLAAASDPHAIGYLGLDPVASGGLEAEAVGWAGPAMLIVGDASACNADGNANLLAALLPGAAFVRVPGATHCAFEDPYDPRCEWVCGRMDENSAASIRATIRGTAMAWLFALSRARP